ncbi:hypothetical protein [Brumimicrobium aurantiacum]|uniref:Outer membrane protein beta-barrel domain-containing protein n=1 Tax=Brumimicrobium aurantiacum TaxID=1737063 RepID=A0A3E1EUW6_9FLAO|nr:hypothetical protein [Brumimicrobium aurantiacum]RFC53330.1 hypothetical protein DXU93_12920 [Brumimicrobium aurantiacum]
MKKIFTLILITLITVTASAQYRSGSSIGKLKIRWYKTGWFLDANGGARILGTTSANTDMKLGGSVNAGIGYFFNDKIALKGRVDANQFRAQYSNGNIDQSLTVGVSGEVMVRLLQLIHHKRARNFALNVHAGSGLSALINPSFRKQVENNGGELDGKLLNNADNIGHVIFGITPQYHFNSRWSINLDVSSITHFKQFRTFDTHEAVRADNPTGFLSGSIGLTFRP